MKRSVFATKILGLKLHKYQKKFLDKKFSKKDILIMSRQTGRGLTYYAMIKYLHEMYQNP